MIIDYYFDWSDPFLPNPYISIKEKENLIILETNHQS